ncbi:MAG: phage holin family protein [Thermomicrobium sp.]|nr:phage holin family protein [Thermomicrobium sp.]MDW8007295.1 phage holin family protein [Thermomicrobium sp.]
MDNQERWKLAGQAVIAVIGAFLDRVPEAVVALWLLMLIDILTGMIAAGIRGDLSSEASWRGMGRKAVTLLIVAAAWVIERHIDLDLPVSLASAIALFYCAQEGLSIVENAAEAGVPVPQLLRDALARIDDEAGRREGERER